MRWSLSSRKCFHLALCFGSAVVCAAAGFGQNLSEQYLFQAANQERALRGLQPVRWDMHLLGAARRHALEMERHGDISHQFAGEPDLAARGGAAGARFSLISENVAEASNAALIHDLWMHSEGHRANLLDPKVDSIGIAVVQLRGQLYAVEDFARVVWNLSLDQQEGTVANLLAPTGLALSTGTADARVTCAMETGYAGTRKPWFVMRYTSADLHLLPEQLTERIASGKYRQAVIGACSSAKQEPFASYTLAVLLYP